MGKKAHTKKLRIFLADDHTILREGLKALVNAQLDMEVIGEAGDGKEAYEKAKKLLPDVVIMDISMPEWDGAQATTHLKQACPEINVLVLTVQEDAIYLSQLLKAGASGYLLKRAVVEELAQAIRIVAAGGQYLDPAMATMLMNFYAQDAPSRSGSREATLSERETEVLRLVARGYANKEIAAELAISVRTVETYKSRSMEKLDLHSRADIVRYALREKWLQDT